MTPTTISDLKGASHTLIPMVPSDNTFSGWKDNGTEPERIVTWDQNKKLIFTLISEKPMPTAQVQLTVKAINIDSNEPLEITVDIDGMIYNTPVDIPIQKGRISKIHIETAAAMTFEGWSDGQTTSDRGVLCDFDQVMTAKFRPRPSGAALNEGLGTIQTSMATIRDSLDSMAKSIKLRFDATYNTTYKNIGAIMMLLSKPFSIEVNASGGKSLGLEKLTISASASDEKRGELISCLTQLRDYLETTSLTLTKETKDFTKLNELISIEALSALEKMEGTLGYRIIALSLPKNETPTRTLQGVLRDFKRGE